MVVEAFSFKDHLRLTDRLEIALEYLRLGGFYGVVTDLADAYNTNRQRIYDILNRIFLAFRPKPPGPESKPVECFNSILRPIQQVKKQVTQEFLWLKALHHNMKNFRQGKRKGFSPFQLLGIDFGTQDWIELLENYQLAA